MKKKFLYCLIMLLIVCTGCSNVKNLGRRLDKEEKIINNSKIQYLKKSFKDVNIRFMGREQGNESCVCIKEFIDNSCLKYDCKIIEDKYVWKYNICSNKSSLFCAKAQFDDVTNSWYINNENDFKFINIVLDTLEKNNVAYSTFTSIGNSNYFLIIKKEPIITHLTNAIKTINEQYLNIGNSGQSIEIIILSEKNYNYILKNTNKSTSLYISDDLYKILSGKENYVMKNYGINEIDDNMFECSSSDFSNVSYELKINMGKLNISCVGIY